MLRTFLKPLSLIPAILVMYMIFQFSAQEGETSSQLSYQISYEVVEVGGEILGADLEPWEIDNLANRFHTPIRKLAHMAEYFALAIAVAFPLYVYGLRGILLMLFAGAFCVAFSCGDEYHQSFVAGRGPAARDVLIDSIGIFFGIVVVRIIGWTGRMTVFRAPRKEPRREEYEEYNALPEAGLSRREKKKLKRQNRGRTDAYGSGGMSGTPYPGPYAGAGRTSGAPPYAGGPYAGGSYASAGRANGVPPYAGAGRANGAPPYTGGSYADADRANGVPPYPGASGTNGTPPYAGGAYSATGGANGTPPYAGANGTNGAPPYPGEPYAGNAYPNGSQPGQPYYGPSYPYEPQTPQYIGQQDRSSDELSEDMPLSHLLKPRK